MDHLKTVRVIHDLNMAIFIYILSIIRPTCVDLQRNVRALSVDILRNVRVLYLNLLRTIRAIYKII